MKKIDLKVVLLFLGIVAVSAVLRFWQLGEIPPSLDWDEASWGYNAYSIIETGKDEYGKRLPIVIQSLNDYKPALYMYLVIPVIYILGLTDFAVRFPNALFGVFSVIFTYFLVKELLGRRSIALLSSFLLAVSPWAIQFSRYAHEGTVGLTFNLLMALFFLKGLKKPKFMLLSALFAGISIYTYQNQKAFVPLFGLVLLISFFRQFLKLPGKYIIYSVLIGLIVVLPMFFYIIATPNSLTRATGSSILKGPSGVLNQQFYPRRGLDNIERGDIVGRIKDNRRVVYAKAIVGNYLSHFDPNFLFVKSENIGRHSPPGMGHLYLIELSFFLIGLYFLVFGKYKKNIKIFIYLWMLVTPIAAAFTWDVPNSGRTLNFLPTFQIITAIGIISFYLWLVSLKIKSVFKNLTLSVIAFFALFNFVYYLNQYFVQYNYFSSGDFQYGYSEIIPEVQKLYPNYEKIIVSNEKPLDQSYIFFLYNLKYPPSLYQKKATKGEYKTFHSFDKYEFSEIRAKDWLNSRKNQLFINSSDNFPKQAEKYILKEIKFLNNETAIYIVAGRDKAREKLDELHN